MILLLAADFIRMLIVILIAFGLGYQIVQRYHRYLTTLELYVCAETIGVFIWALLTYGFAWVNASIVVTIMTTVVGLWGWYEWWKRRKDFLKTKVNWILTGLVVMGVAGQLFLVAPSGLVYEDGLRMYGVNAHDGMWHVALMQSLSGKLPAKIPTMAGVSLKGYHLLIDLWGSELVKTFGVSALGLVFRWLPLLFATITGLGVYTLVTRMAQSKLSAYLGVFLSYFAGSFGFLLPLISKGITWSESTFWSQQSISTFINLPLGTSFAGLVVALLLMWIWTEQQKRRGLLWLAAMLIGMLVSVKAYTGILAMGGFGVLSVLTIYLKRQRWMVGPLLIASIVFAGLVWSQTSETSGLLWEPGWFVKTMMEAPDRVSQVQWELQRQAYVYTKNWLGLVKLWSKALLIFLVGNMGLRVVGWLTLPSLWRSKQRIYYSGLWVMVLGGIVLPLLFIQKGIVWNTIQFIYVSLFILNILTARLVGRLTSYRLKVILGMLIMMLALPTTVRTLQRYANMYQEGDSYQLINHNELETLSALSRSGDGVVLAPYNQHAYITGISGKAVYFADDTQAMLMGIYHQERKEWVNKIFCDEMRPENLAVFLAQNKISYILNINTDNSDCFTRNLGELPFLIQLINNEDSQLYQYR